MIYKTLGVSGIKIPAIAQGTSGFGNYANADAAVVEERIAALRQGVEAGLTLIDTAELYGGGFSEEVVGKAIGGMRSKVIISSKFNPREDVAPAFERSLEGSLARLKTDYIDLYQIHWPNPFIPLEPVLEAIFQAIKKGLIRAVGVSNFPTQYMKDAQMVFEGTIVSNQFEYNLLDRSIEDDILPYCEKNNMTLLGYSPLNQGKVVGMEEHRVTLGAIAEKHEKTIAQVVLRWLVSHAPVVAMAKTKTQKYIEESVGAMDFDLSAEEVAQISALKAGKATPVPISSIRVVAPAHRKLCHTIEEAKENKDDLLPSPSALAQMYAETGFFKPIRLTRTADTSGRFLYDIDQYDVMDQVKKYWAWQIAKGKDEPIPAYIL